jgi:hypothetical protein
MFPARMPRPPFGGAVRYSHRRACGIFRLALPGPDTTRRTRVLDLVIAEHEKRRLTLAANDRFVRSGVEIKDVYGTLEH